MDVLSDVARGVVVNHVLNVVYIYASGDNIRANQYVSVSVS